MIFTLLQKGLFMKSKKIQTSEKRRIADKPNRTKANEAYGDKAPICINTGCALRKKARCFGFEGCPGFKAK
jgi:hypothetical protein